MSICPKNKSSKSRRDKRRANWKMSAPNLVKCSKCGALMMSHRVCKSCGSSLGIIEHLKTIVASNGFDLEKCLVWYKINDYFIEVYADIRHWI